jgi:hypothetical protein
MTEPAVDRPPRRTSTPTTARAVVYDTTGDADVLQLVERAVA